jgi:hypothetical protein
MNTYTVNKIYDIDLNLTLRLVLIYAYSQLLIYHKLRFSQKCQIREERRPVMR